MTSIHVIENKISSIRKYLTILEPCRSISLEQLMTDYMMRGAVERYLYLAAQSTIDLADAFIAFRGLRKPSNMGESFTVLREAGVLPAPQAEELVRMTGFRNALAHNYEGLDYEIVHSVLRERLEEFEEFAALISKQV